MGVRDLVNLVLAGSVATHPLWIKNKSMPSPAAPDADAVYRTTMANRIGEKFAHLPFLDYDNATDEDSLSLLMLSAVQAGVKPPTTLDLCYALFEKTAPGPMMDMADVPPPKKERKPRSGPLPPIHKSWLREAPYLDGARQASAGKVDSFAQQFKNMTQSEQDSLISAMGIPVPANPPAVLPVVVQPQPLIAPSIGIWAEIALGLGPLMAQMQASIESFTAIARKKNKHSDSDEEEDLTGEARLEKLLRFGGA
jgi:hypothetical protein